MPFNSSPDANLPLISAASIGLTATPGRQLAVIHELPLDSEIMEASASEIASEVSLVTSPRVLLAGRAVGDVPRFMTMCAMALAALVINNRVT